jgi:hypothetical protein
MWFPRASSVHTFGMIAPIKVVRIDTRGRVLEVRLVPPRRIVWPSLGVRGVLECRPDVDLRVGDRLTTTEDDPYAGQPPRPAAPVTTQEPS